MVDSIYYEEANLDKSRAEKILSDFFGSDFESYNLNTFFNGTIDENKGNHDKSSFTVLKEEILNPTFEKYLLIRKMLFQIKINRPDQIGGNKYNALLMILVVMVDCISFSLMEEWESNPAIQFFNKQDNYG